MPDGPITSGTVEVFGSPMHYRSVGDGPAVLFLHGNPTSSYLWRHVLARSPGGYRCIAVDLIGMGRSAKPAIDYRLADHIRYVDGFVDALDLGAATLVGHDWGVAIALDRLRRHPEQVTAVAFMEGHIRPLAGWEDFDAGGRDLFGKLRTPEVGERMVLADNYFVETLLPAAMTRPLSPAEWAVYREPFPDRASRVPLLQWAREIPVSGQPADTAALMTAAAAHLQRSETPKLLVHGSPGVLVPAATVAWCRDTMSLLTVVAVGTSAHFLPEDQPAEVADAVWGWLSGL